MLILGRYLNETIVIGEDVEIRVTSIRGGYVRIGITAPPDVEIVRGELASTWRGRPAAKGGTPS